MNEYTYTVTLKVTVEAFAQGDADEMVEDAFGLGDHYGVEVREITIA